MVGETLSDSEHEVQRRDEKDFKVLILGDSGVGKTSILRRFIYDDYSDTSSSVGVDFLSKPLTIEDVNVNLQIWDTAGQERFRTITSSYYRGAKIILIVYDISNRTSYHNIQAWLSDTYKYTSYDIKLLLVGHKYDLSSLRAVSEMEGRTFAEKINADFFECSAKTAHNILNIFIQAARRALEQFNISSAHNKDGENSLSHSQTKVVIPQPPRAHQSKCCK